MSSSIEGRVMIVAIVRAVYSERMCIGEGWCGVIIPSYRCIGISVL